MAGFEPTNARVKVWCLTAWRHPNRLVRRALGRTHGALYHVLSDFAILFLFFSDEKSGAVRLLDINLNLRYHIYVTRALPVDGSPVFTYKEVTVSLGGLAVTSLYLSILFHQGDECNYKHTESEKLRPCNHCSHPLSFSGGVRSSPPKEGEPPTVSRQRHQQDIRYFLGCQSFCRNLDADFLWTSGRRDGIIKGDISFGTGGDSS